MKEEVHRSGVRVLFPPAKGEALGSGQVTVQLTAQLAACRVVPHRAQSSGLSRVSHETQVHEGDRRPRKQYCRERGDAEACEGESEDTKGSLSHCPDRPRVKTLSEHSLAFKKNYAWVSAIFCFDSHVFRLTLHYEYFSVTKVKRIIYNVLVFLHVVIPDLLQPTPFSSLSGVFDCLFQNHALLEAPSRYKSCSEISFPV